MWIEGFRPGRVGPAARAILTPPARDGPRPADVERIPMDWQTHERASFAARTQAPVATTAGRMSPPETITNGGAQ